MRAEVPVCTRCCFCFPLRHGLLVWGYFKLIIATLLLLSILVSLYAMLTFFIRHDAVMPHIQEIVILSVTLSLVIVDITLHVIFVVGAHKKQVNLLRVYYFYGLVLWLLMALLGVGFTSFMMYIFAPFFHYHLEVLLLSSVCLIFIYLVVQIYILLLIRSEVVKLNNIGQFRFVNNAVEAECTLKIEYSYYKKGTNNGHAIVEDETEDKNEIQICEKAKETCGSNCCKIVVSDKGFDVN